MNIIKMFNRIKQGIMKKNLTITKMMLAVGVSLLATTGLFAQTHNGTAVPGNSGDYASGATQTSTYITEGTTVPVYALPDPYYHPSYDVATSNWTLTDGFTWTWAEGTTTLTFSQNDVQDNYVAITAPAASAAGSPYTVSVTENAPAAYGGCSGAATNLTVNVVTAPTATFGATTTYAYCEGNASLPTAINATISGGWQQYHLVWSLEIATLDAANAKEFYYDDEAGTNPAAGQKYAADYTTAAPATVAASGAHDIMTVASFPVINNGTRDAVTVYTYTLTSINDRASRFGNYIALNGSTADQSLFTYYNIGETLTVTVYI